MRRWKSRVLRNQLPLLPQVPMRGHHHRTSWPSASRGFARTHCVSAECYSTQASNHAQSAVPYFSPVGPMWARSKSRRSRKELL